MTRLGMALESRHLMSYLGGLEHGGCKLSFFLEWRSRDMTGRPRTDQDKACGNRLKTANYGVGSCSWANLWGTIIPVANSLSSPKTQCESGGNH